MRAGWVAAGSLQRSTRRAIVTYAVLATFVLGYAAAWFLFNLGRMPPYVPGATTDPTFAPPEVAGECDFCGSPLVAQPRSADPVLAPERFARLVAVFDEHLVRSGELPENRRLPRVRVRRPLRTVSPAAAGGPRAAPSRRFPKP